GGELALLASNFRHAQDAVALFRKVTQESCDFVPLSPRLNTGDSDVRTEGSSLPAETKLEKKLLDLLKDQLDLTPTLTNSYPDDIHPLEVWKRSSALDLEGERWECYLCKR